ncbi:hypothetical protein ACWCO0_35435 [Streptomyces tubercidicus]
MDRLGRNVVDCLNTGYKMRDERKLLITHGHDGSGDLNDATARPGSDHHTAAEGPPSSLSSSTAAAVLLPVIDNHLADMPVGT